MSTGIAGTQGTKRASTRTSMTTTGSSGTGGFGGAGTRESRQAQQMLMNPTQLQLLNNNIQSLNFFINHGYMASLHKGVVQVPAALPSNRASEIAIFELTQIMLNEKENTYEKLISVYASMNTCASSIGILIKSDGELSRFYLCAAHPDGKSASGGIFQSGITGHFPGSQMRQLSDRETENLLKEIQWMPGAASVKDKYICSLSVVPSRREQEQKSEKVSLSAQGIEKFVDAMRGRRYSVLLLSEAVSVEQIDAQKQGLESLYTMMSPFSKESVSFSENESDATTYSMSSNLSSSISKSISTTYGVSNTTGSSTSRGGNSGTSSHGDGFGFSSGSCWGQSTNTSRSTSQGGGTSTGNTDTTGKGEQFGDSHTDGRTRTLNLTREVKNVQNCMARLDAEIQRIEQNRGFGMWNTCCYVMAEDMPTVNIAASSLQSLVVGDAAYGGNAYTNLWSSLADRSNAQPLLTSLAYLRHPWISIPASTGSSVGAQTVSTSLLVSGRDLPTVLNLPGRSVPGLTVGTMAEFGRNFSDDFRKRIKRPIEFGNVIHMGEKEPTRVLLDLDKFSSHCFICGAAGSGKSNTTYNLMQELIKYDVPFLVIEPAKGEYKLEFAGLPGVQIYTAKPDGYRMLSLNPFEFDKRIHISEHLAKLQSVINTCWPLYGPMPDMLKDALEEAYVSCGWDLELSERVINTGREFPTFEDVMPIIQRIINSSQYSADAKGDFKGALVTRIKSLTNGFEGRIFGNVKGIPDKELFEKNSIIDLSNIGNPETRSLIMGILIIKLREYRYSTQTETNSALKHVTILEEAHNILKRCSHETSQDSGNVQGASVGMLVDCIAEMRSTGEGIMIIDQSPSAVDLAAIKNTAIKIAMRLPEKEDCETIANALSLREDQMRELSRLKVGVAAIFHAGWDEAVLAKMGDVWSKPYAAPAPEVNRFDLLKFKSAAIQWICEKIVEDDRGMLSTMRGIRSYLQSLRGIIPSVNDNLYADMLQQINSFITELNSRYRDLESLSRGEEGDLRAFFGKFVRGFLNLGGMFRVNGLKGEGKNMLAVTDDDRVYHVDWWTVMENAIIGKYINMPMRYGVSPLLWGTPDKVMDAQYIRSTMRCVLESLVWDDMERGLEYSVYSNALDTLGMLYLKERRAK